MTATGIKTRARAGALAGALAMILATAAQAQDLNFDIPAGTLVAALDAYSKQTGQQLVYLEKNLEGKKSPGAHGAMSSEQALKALLAGTGLEVKRDASGAIAIFPAEAVAGAASTETAGSQKLEEIIVTATAISHLYVTSRSVSRIDTDPMNLPQSVTAVQADLLYAQQATSLTDVLNNVAGMEVDAKNNVQSRGFSVTAARNGTLDSGALGGEVRTRPNVATQRVEVVKGPEQILQGSFAGIGGTVNVITKVPEADSRAYLGTAVGSQAYWRVDAEVNDTLWGGDDGRLMGMVIGSFSDEGRGFKDTRGDSQNFAAAGLRWEDTQLGSDLSVVYEYNETAFGTSEAAATMGKAFRNGGKLYVFGNPDGHTDGTENTVDVNFQQRIWGSWKLGVNYVWRKQELSYFQSGGFPDYARPYIVTATQASSGHDTTEDVIKVDIRGEFNTGPVEHKVMLAWDYASNDGTFAENVFVGRFQTDLNTGVKTFTPYDPYRVYPGSKSSASDEGVLLIDQLNWGKWHALLGFRWLTQTSSDKSEFFSEHTSADSTLPQLGLVYAVNPSLSLYASASQGYQPNFDLKDINGVFLPDTTYTQAEGGVKALLFQQQMAVTVAAYQIKQKDVAKFGGFIPETGEYWDYTVPGLTSQGVEVEVSGQPIRGLQVRMSFAGATASEDKTGEPPYMGYLPYKFSLWSQYWIGRDAGNGWWVAGGLDAYDAPVRASDQASLPGATTVDLSTGYEAEHWTAVAGVKNVGNVETYNPTSGVTVNGTSIAQPSPDREYRLDLGYRF